MSENDVIVWSKNEFLTWSDYKAESHPGAFEDAHSTIKYRCTWTVNSEKIGNEILFFIENIILHTEFYPLLSWVRPSQTSDDLLKHEQGHFDLAQSVNIENIKKLQDLFYGKQYQTRGKNEEQRKQFAKEDSGRMIALEVEKLDKYLLEQRYAYDVETDYGKNIEKQKKFNLMFAQLRS